MFDTGAAVTMIAADGCAADSDATSGSLAFNCAAKEIQFFTDTKCQIRSTQKAVGVQFGQCHLMPSGTSSMMCRCGGSTSDAYSMTWTTKTLLSLLGLIAVVV